MLAAGAAAWLAPGVARAQEAGARPALRADYVSARVPGVLAGIGAGLPVGSSVRIDAVGGGGMMRTSQGWRGSGRVDLAARFLLDPYAESRRAAYGGAGITGHDDGRGRWRPYLLVFMGIEGGVRGGVRPAFEVGLGGGVRAGVVIRGADARAR